MRITIKFDSAETERVRELAKALHNVGLTAQLKVGLNGPEKWEGETPPMQPWQFASVVANLVKYHGPETIAEHYAKERAQ
jgi:hypothetical protein